MESRMTPHVDRAQINVPILLLAMLISASLSACGGGGSSDSSSSPSVVSETTDTTANTPTDTASNGSTSSADGRDSGFYVNAANSALLSGPVIGSANGDQRFAVRDIPFTVLQDSPVLKVVSINTAAIYPAFLAPQVGIIGIIENVSNEHQCFVIAQFVTLQKSATAASTVDFQTGNSERLIGESAGFGASTTLDCAAPGGKYYFYSYAFGAESTADIGSVEIDSISTTGQNIPAGGPQVTLSLAPEPTAIPTSYQINADGEVEINVANRSDGAITGSILVGTTVFGLNATGQPVFVSDEDGIDKLQPGEEGTVTLDLAASEFAGESTSLRVVVDHFPSF